MYILFWGEGAQDQTLPLALYFQRQEFGKWPDVINLWVVEAIGNRGQTKPEEYMKECYPTEDSGLGIYAKYGKFQDSPPHFSFPVPTQSPFHQNQSRCVSR